MQKSEKSGEWKNGWPTVVASLAGIAFVSVSTNSIGLFMPELEKAFGWSRAEVASGIAINSVISMILFPFIGIAVDKGHGRIVVLVSLTCVSLTFAAFGLSPGALTIWWVQWLLYSIFASGINVAIWSTAVSRRFHKARGAALSIVLTGSSISGFTVPLVVRVLIDNVGWRGAYAGVAAIYGILPLLVVWLLFDRGTATQPRLEPGNRAKSPAVEVRGLGFKEALLNERIIMIMAATLIGFTVAVGSMVHVAPLMSSKGMSPVLTATAAALLAGGAIPGKLAFGSLIDYFPGNIVGAIVFALPSAALLVLRYFGSDPVIALTAIAIAGIGFGGMVPVTAYLTGRYAGMRNFGKVFGVVTSLMGLGAGIGPVTAGMMFDATSSYDKPLLIAAVMAVAAGGLILLLGRYPDFTSAAELPSED